MQEWCNLPNSPAAARPPSVGKANPLLRTLAVGPRALEEQNARQVATHVNPCGGKEKPKQLLTNQEVTIRIIKASKKEEQEGQGAVSPRHLLTPWPQLGISELED